MLHYFIMGLIVGWGVAIPIGPMNLEIIRRNLHHGLKAGIHFGVGICAADITYLFLLNIGALSIINHSRLVGVIGIIGAGILMWFAYKTLRMKAPQAKESFSDNVLIWHHWRDGYILTLMSPFTVLFWLSMSSTIAVHATGHSMFTIALGVVMGTVSWMLGFNLVLHHTRHYLSAKTMHYFNLVGGMILLGFAFYGLWKAVYLLF